MSPAREVEEAEEEAALSEDYLRRHCKADLAEVQALELRVDSAQQSVDCLGEYLPNLRRLWLSESSLLCVRELGASLRHLEVLWLARCGLQDLDGVTLLEELRELYIPFNDVADFTPLKWLDHLEVLDAEANAISDFQDLEELTRCFHLRDLTIRGNPAASRARGCTRQKLIDLLPQLQTLDDLPVSLLQDDTENTDASKVVICDDQERYLEQYLESDLDFYLDLYLGPEEVAACDASEDTRRCRLSEGLWGHVSNRREALFADEPGEEELVYERLKLPSRNEAADKPATGKTGFVLQMTPRGKAGHEVPSVDFGDTSGAASSLTRGSSLAGNPLSAMRRRGATAGESPEMLGIRELLKRYQG